MQLLLELAHRFGVGEVVVLGVVALHRGLQLRVVGLRRGPRDDAVVRHRGLDRVGPQRREPEREPAAHAEADDAHAVAGHRVVAAEVVDGAGHVLGRLLDVQRHHQLTGLVGLRMGPSLAVVQVGRERDEPFAGVPVAHLLDLVVEPPPLLDHDDPGPRPLSGTAR